MYKCQTPKGAALLAEIEGTIHIEKQANTGRTMIRITRPACSPTSPGQGRAYQVVPGQALTVEEGQTVVIGTKLSAGACDPRQLLHLLGREATAHYLVNEVQRVYRATGVFLHDKHVEVIVRQMLRYVQVTDPGDTDLLPTVILDRFSFLNANTCTLAQGGQPALARPVLLGLTRAALCTSSWVAAASFQETSRVLTRAAIWGQIDSLTGYKQRVILGTRIPTSEAFSEHPCL